jgi:hypothetical protein
MQNTGSDELAFEGTLQVLQVRLVAKNTQGYGLITGAGSTGGPFDQLREVEEKSGFDLVFIGRVLGAGRLRNSQGKQDDAKKLDSSRGDAAFAGRLMHSRIFGCARHSRPSFRRTTKFWRRLPVASIRAPRWSWGPNIPDGGFL